MSFGVASRNNYSKVRPIGKFSISRTFMADDWRSVRDVFSRVVVVRCECDFPMDQFIYTAFSDEFDDIPEGEEPPTYYVEEFFDAETRSIHVTRFVRAKPPTT